MRFAIQWSQRDDSDLPEFASVARTAHSGRLVRPDRGEKRMPNVILINPFEVPNAPVSGSVTVKMHFHPPDSTGRTRPGTGFLVPTGGAARMGMLCCASGVGKGG
jgi:hypothetical protein